MLHEAFSEQYYQKAVSQTGLPLTQKEEILETSLLCLYVKYYISKVLEPLPFVAWWKWEIVLCMTGAQDHQSRFQYLTSWNGVLFLVHPDNCTLLNFLANSKMASSALVSQHNKLFFFLGLFMVHTSSDFLLQPLVPSLWLEP